MNEEEKNNSQQGEPSPEMPSEAALPETDATAAQPPAAEEQTSTPKKTTHVIFKEEAGPDGRTPSGMTRVILDEKSKQAAEAAAEEDEEEIPLGVTAATRKSGMHPSRPATIRVTRRPAEPPGAGAPAAGSVPPKKETTRLAPEEPKKFSEPATTITAEPQPKAPKTIRLQRPATTIVAEPPAASRPPTGPVSSTVKTIKLKQDTTGIARPGLTTEKKQKETSRIHLDAGPEEGEQPKTIKLKKPSSIMAVKQTVMKERPADIGIPTSKGETARIEIVKPEESATPLTQRRTIKLQRRAGDEAAAEEARPEWREAKGAAEPTQAAKVANVIFSVVSVAALLVIGFLVYVLAIQALPEKQLPVPGFWM